MLVSRYLSVSLGALYRAVRVLPRSRRHCVLRRAPSRRSLHLKQYDDASSSCSCCRSLSQEAQLERREKRGGAGGTGGGGGSGSDAVEAKQGRKSMKLGRISA